MRTPLLSRTGSVACRAVTSQAMFLNTDVDVELGTTTTERLVVVNDSDAEETYRLTPAGLAAGWANLRPTVVTVPANTQDEVDVEIHPPRLPSTAAGPTALTVRVAPQRPDAEVIEASITLDVQPVVEHRLSLLQPAQRGRFGAGYELTLENRGNTQASCRLRLVDPSGRVEGEFEPPAIGVDPGATGLVRLKLRTTQRQWERRRRTLPFRVEAEQSGAPTVRTSGSLVQLPMLPEHLWSWVAGIVAVLAVLVGGWFGIVEPAIHDAARDAVRDAVREQSSSTVVPSTAGPSTTVDAPTTTTPAPTTTTAPTTPTAALGNGAGTAVTTRLAPEVEAGKYGEDTYVVPDGSVLRITSFIVQNPNDDKGRAQVNIDDDEKLEWSLEYVLPSLDQPFPTELQPGQVIHFVVTCDQPGSATAGSCQPGLTILGEIVPA